MKHKLSITNHPEVEGLLRAACSCKKWFGSDDNKDDLEKKFRRHSNKFVDREPEYQEFVRQLKEVNSKQILNKEKWVDWGCPTANEYAKKIYGFTLAEAAEKLLEKFGPKPEPMLVAERAPTAIRVKLVGRKTRVKLLKISENISSGLEIPFCKAWMSLPDQTTTVQEMSELFYQAEPSKRLATAQNMIRRAVQRGDAVTLD